MKKTYPEEQKMKESRIKFEKGNIFRKRKSKNNVQKHETWKDRPHDLD